MAMRVELAPMRATCSRVSRTIDFLPSKSSARMSEVEARATVHDSW